MVEKKEKNITDKVSKPSKQSKTSKKSVSNKASKTNKATYDITKIYAPKRSEASTVSDELKKVTSSMSKEQIKKPRKIVFMVCFYMTLCLAAFVFCFIKFSKPKAVDSSDNKYKEMYEELYREVHESTALLYEKETETSIVETVPTRDIEELLRAIEANKETNKETIETSTTKKVETKKATTKAIETTQETVKTAILNKSKTPTTTVKQNTNLPVISKIIPKYDKELYSFSTYYQFDKDELQQAYNQLEMYYDKIKDLVFGQGISLNDKGTNGIIYLNYVNMKNFMTTVNDAIRAKYIALVDVQTSDAPLTFDFKNARDMDIYYEIPASDGKKRLNLMVLKKSKIGFSQSYNLTSTLEILDIEFNTKHNPYFDIEDVVGENPKIKGRFKEEAYNLDDMLYTTRFNRINYDKKGYITDIFYVQ